MCEVVVATALLALAIVSLAELVGIAVVANRHARDTTYATLLAFQKIEELRGAAYTDLAASPPGALDQNTSGCVDFLDERGSVLGAGSMPVGTVYIRRWSIDPIAVQAGGALALQVVVTTLRNVRTARLVAVRNAP